MLTTIASTIYEMVEDSQRVVTPPPLNTKRNRRSSSTKPQPQQLNHVIVARLSSSIFLSRDHYSAMFQRTTWNRTTNTHHHQHQQHTSLDNSTPAVHFVQSNSFLDKGDNLVVNIGHPINQPRQCKEEDMDTWDNLEFLYNMLTHSIESMNEEECETWLDCLEQDSFAFKNKQKHQQQQQQQKNSSSSSSSSSSSEEDNQIILTFKTPHKNPLTSLLRMLVGVIVDSESSAERTASKNVLDTLFDNPIFGIRTILRTMVCSEIVTLAAGDLNRNRIVDDREMLHVSDLLDLLFKIVSTFPTPLTRKHRPILMNVMVSIHKSSGFPCIVNDAVPVILHLLQKGGAELTLQYLRKIIKIIPKISPRSERAYLTEMYDLLQHIDGERRNGRNGMGNSMTNTRHNRNDVKMLDECMVLIFKCIANGLRSEHFEVSLHASKSFSENHAVQMAIRGQDRRTLLPIVIEALLDNKEYWHDGVSTRCHDLMEAFRAMDRHLVRRCIRSHVSYVNRSRRRRSSSNRHSEHSETATSSNGGSDNESVTSETTSEYSTSSYMSSEYTNSSESPRVIKEDTEDTEDQIPVVPPRRSKNRKNRKKTKSKSKSRQLPTPPATPERTSMPPTLSTPPLSPSFIDIQTDGGSTPSPPRKESTGSWMSSNKSSLKSCEWRMPTTITKSRRTPPKWTRHEGKKKRLAWGSGLDGGKVLSKKEGSVLRRAKERLEEEEL